MVLTAEETRELEALKQTHKKELIEMQGKADLAEHQRRMTRLDKLHQIALAGGIGYIEK